MKIHPTVIVDPKAQIADDVEIGPYSVVEADVIIESGCRIASSVLLASGARLGPKVKVFHSAVIGTVPQDLKFKDEVTTAEIGANTVVREFCTINRATSHSKRTIVGADCLLMAYTHVAHDCRLGNKVILANAVNMGGHVVIEEQAIIGGMTAIHQFNHIGQLSMVGGFFRVTQDVPPYALAGGWPLRFEGLNVVGLRRRGFTPEQRKAIKDAYNVIYRSGLLLKDALAKIRSQPMTPEVENIVSFIENSERGIIRPTIKVEIKEDEE